jgi:hypothetical protein
LSVASSTFVSFTAVYVRDLLRLVFARKPYLRLTPFSRSFYSRYNRLFILSSAQLSLFNLCSSGLLGLSMFDAPVLGLQKSRMSCFGVSSNVLKDLLQLVIQIYLAVQLDTFDQPLVMASIVLSAASLILGWYCVTGLANFGVTYCM